MPIDGRPTLATVGFELGIYALGAHMLYRLWRTRRGDVPLVLACMIFAGAIEATDIRATHSYYYIRELIMIGGAPTWFPLSIAMAWALVLHSTQLASQRLPIAPWQRPFVAALLAVLIDLVLDPAVASARIVASLANICNATNLPHGSATGLGLWVWCVPSLEHWLIQGIPFANFYAWGVVVLVWAFCSTAMRKLFGLTEAHDRLDLRAVAFASATGLVSYAGVWTLIKAYTPMVMHGVPEWLLLLVPFAPGVVVFARAGAARTNTPIDTTTWAFPAGALGYCLIAMVIDLAAGRGASGFVIYLLAAIMCCVAALVWVLFGRRGLRARSHRTAHSAALATPSDPPPTQLAA